MDHLYEQARRDAWIGLVKAMNGQPAFLHGWDDEAIAAAAADILRDWGHERTVTVEIHPRGGVKFAPAVRLADSLSIA